MNIPSLEFYVESIRHLTSSVAVRRQLINSEESYKKCLDETIKKFTKALNACSTEDNMYNTHMGLLELLAEREINKTLLTALRAKQKHEKRMLAYFVAQQRDILDYYKATEELYEETL